MQEFNISAFEKYDKQWALVTAGSPTNFNTMTISWGGLGTLWNKPVATIYIRPSRYTFGFIEESEYFTVSFYPPEFKSDLGILGRKSGRDGDKLSLTKLTPIAIGESVSFEQAETTLLCKKIYWQDLTRDHMTSEVLEHNYAAAEVPHRMYIGEVVELLQKSR